MRTVVVSAFIAAIAVAPIDAQVAVDAAAITTTGEIRIADATDRKKRPPILPISESVVLSAESPTATDVPAGIHQAQTGSFSVRGASVRVVVGSSNEDSDAPDIVYVDLNGDGTLEDAERLVLDSRSLNVRRRVIVRGELPKLVLTVAGAKIVASFSYSRVGDRPARAALQFAGYLHAEVTLDDERRIIAVVDNDLDGEYDGPEDLWVLTKQGADPTSLPALSALSERRFENENLIGIAVSGHSIAVTVTPAARPDPVDLVSHRARAQRFWAKRFAAERADFAAEKQIDLGRPVATTPIAWQYVTVEQGLRQAKATGKPMLVDLTAFWSADCYRLDDYTYRDKAVADLVNSAFIPVRIIQEQDVAGDYPAMSEKLGTSSVPAVGILGADGVLLHQFGGWKKPEDFIAELHKADTGG